ncbi:14174_t:CDS:2, partial [Funneliformis geosporum]
GPALLIDAETWPDDANTNLHFLKRDVGQLINENTNYKKTMWERIEMKLEQVNVESLDSITQYVPESSNLNLLQRCPNLMLNMGAI